ncbi:MAG: exodeoxyribonuclease VII large subunit [Planctomycetes bacterium]|nr:exodeoxyribonuclease VII large subunit [Planctomycetota bacterium]
MPRGFRDPHRDQANLFQQAMNSALPQSADENEETPRPQSVAEFTREVKNLLEANLRRVWVEGEISNLSQPASGHLYFTLKDESAALQCVMWKSGASRSKCKLEDGLHVTIRGNITVYERQGRYQVVCDSIQAVGQGDLQKKYEELVAKLRAEGLFEPQYKKPLPEVPNTVGVVTSATGAAVRDILRILRRRLPGVRIIVSPCRVQGAGVEKEIAQALKNCDDSGLCDVIIIGRGGGSAEDLWCFNEEALARAVFACKTPVVSAVGHETDFSICDLVADYRAATPSEAAEAVVPEAEELAGILRGAALRLGNSLKGRLAALRLYLAGLASRPVLRDPMLLVGMKAQQIDELYSSLSVAAQGVIEDAANRAALLAAQLQALSPLAVMSRGYSITWDLKKRKLVRSASEVTMDAEIETRLAKGRIRSRVIKVEPETK